MATHHGVYLRLASLGQVDDVHAVVVEILYAAVKVASEEGSGFSRQWDPSEAEL